MQIQPKCFFCKFGEDCQRNHNNQICVNISNCRNNKCFKRHPKECKNFNIDGKCRLKERCAYQHVKQLSNNDIYELVGKVLARNIKEIADLTQEVNELKTKVDILEKNIEIDNSLKQDTDKQPNDIEKDDAKNIFQCDECDYKCKKQLTLSKHKNTKHTLVEFEETASDININSKDKFHYDKCNFSGISKKSLKKHLAQKHKNQKDNILVKCEKCEMKFDYKPKLKFHMEEQHNVYDDENCMCTPQTVCDDCINYWVQKGQAQSEEN